MRRINYFIYLNCIFLIFLLFVGCSDDDGSANELPLNSNVIMIGDSYFDIDSEYIRTNLETLSGERYRHYYKNGAMITDGTVERPSIPQQYENAKAENPDINTVIMDGGGNDILTKGGGWNETDNVCSAASSSACTDLIDDTMDTAAALVTQMKNDGTTYIIYMFYPHLPDNMDWINDALDYALDKAQLFCHESEGCYLIDPIDDFQNHPEYFKADNVHPSEAGGQVLAGLIWQVMINNDIEQN